MTSKDKAKAGVTRKASLARVLKKNEGIKKTVKSAASKLAAVNDVQQQDEVPIQVLEEALTQNEDVEQKVAKAADDLKLVNLKLTEEVAERTVEDIVSRWGGDEFVCLCLEVKQEADVLQLAEKMINRLAEPCEFNGTTLSLRASIGIAMYPADGETAAVLFKSADTAMYEAKGSAGRVVLFRHSRGRKAVA